MIRFKINNKSIKMKISNASIVVEGTYYDGNYTIIPSVEENQNLPTANKVMKEDLKVMKIPYFETSNNHGGQTVYIGNEV